ncbi:MAG: ureidoglycolate lyase, partial [Hyphomicrobiaceae bacterium]
GIPSEFKAFLARPEQCVNYFRNTWHGVLMPIDGHALFTVIDWIGNDKNLEEYTLGNPITIVTTATG